MCEMETGQTMTKKTRRDMFFRQIGAKITYERTIHGMTQEELATSTHINQSTLSRVENGKYNENLSMAMLLDIADALGITPELFFQFRADERALWVMPPEKGDHPPPRIIRSIPVT